MASLRTAFTVIACLALLTSGCVRDLAKTLSELQAVQTELTTKYGDEVNVNINQTNDVTTLSIIFINSKLNDLEKEPRAQRALEAVQIAQSKYKTNKPPDRFLVTFLRNTTRLFIIHYTQSVDFYMFDAKLQPIHTRDTESDLEVREIQTRASYHERVGQSDVSVTTLMLSKAEGLSFTPYFTVNGDANKLKAPPPESVHLDFNSYYKEEKYQQPVVFKFIVDGHSVLQTTGVFTRWLPKTEPIQFCYLTLPYKAFTRITTGEKLTIRVGDQDFPLTDEQYKGLKLMTEFVE